MRKIAQLDIGNSAYVRCHRPGGVFHKKNVTTTWALVSIGNTAYFAMVEMALGFQMVPSYTGALERKQ